jgi:hypothetical protein
LKKLLIGLSLTLVVFAAGCSSPQSERGNRADSPEATATSAPASPSSAAASPAAAEEKTAEVKAAHLMIKIPAEWTLRSGEESFAFQKDDKPVGGLDGIGYSEPESIDSLLPNGAIVDKKETLEGFPVPTVRVHLAIEGRGNEGKREEIHYYYFVQDAKAVYDLRFDTKQITLVQSEKIAKTADVS